MIDYLTASLDVKAVQRVFVVHGEAEVAETYKGHLQNAGFQHIDVPNKGEIVEL